MGIRSPQHSLGARTDRSRGTINDKRLRGEGYPCANADLVGREPWPWVRGLVDLYKYATAGALFARAEIIPFLMPKLALRLLTAPRGAGARAAPRLDELSCLPAPEETASSVVSYQFERSARFLHVAV